MSTGSSFQIFEKYNFSHGKGGGGVEPSYSKSIPLTQTVNIEISPIQNFSDVYLKIFAHFPDKYDSPCNTHKKSTKSVKRSSHEDFDLSH
jgi:hypothetical protein